MNTLISWSEKYIKEADWKDLTLIKFCLCGAGVLIGCALPEKAKKPAIFISAGVFAATYIPLMIKLLKIITGASGKENSAGKV